MEDWTTILKKPKIKRTSKKEKLSKEFIISTLQKSEFILKQNFKGLFIYGSTAYDKHTLNSDLDIAAVFDSGCCTIYDLRKHVESLFGLHVDIAYFYPKSKNSKYLDQEETTLNFISNVKSDAVPVIGSVEFLSCCDFSFTLA